MASNKVWMVKFVAGNPAMYSRIRSSEPMARSQALEQAGNIDDRWRVWVEHVDSGKRIFESSAEVEFGRSHIEEEVCTLS